MEDRHLRLTELASYSGLSVRTLRRFLTDPVHPLPCHRVGRAVLVLRSVFDAWLDEHHTSSSKPAEASDPELPLARRIALQIRGLDR